MSERHANRLLAREGTSIRQLLIERRLAKCSEALEKTERSVSEIAYAFGFRQPNHFTRAFKGYYGISPTEYRASALGTHNLTYNRTLGHLCPAQASDNAGVTSAAHYFGPVQAAMGWTPSTNFAAMIEALGLVI